jgi:hypothetical protein
MAVWLLMSNLPDVQLLIYGLLIHYVFWLWASDFYMWNDICYSSNPPPVLCLYTMRVVQIVRRNLVIVSHTSYTFHMQGRQGHGVGWHMVSCITYASIWGWMAIQDHWIDCLASRLDFSFTLRLASLQGETLGPIWHMGYLFVQECWDYVHLPAT